MLNTESATVTFEHQDGRKLTLAITINFDTGKPEGKISLNGKTPEEHGQDLHVQMCNVLMGSLGLKPDPRYFVSEKPMWPQTQKLEG